MKDNNIKIEDSTSPDTMLTTVYSSVEDKVKQFQQEFKALLTKYDAELEMHNFGGNWAIDERMVVTFAWDEDLANRTSDGIVPEWIIGRWINGK